MDGKLLAGSPLGPAPALKTQRYCCFEGREAVGGGEEGEEEDGADLIPRCQSRSKGREAKNREQ